MLRGGEGFLFLFLFFRATGEGASDASSGVKDVERAERDLP